MNCATARERLQPGFLDQLEREPRVQLLGHLQSCRSCRALATSVDPSVIFSLVPAEEVDPGEVEEIRHTVQAMRRIRSLEASWSRYGQRGLLAGAIAALLLVAVVLLPGSSPEAVDESIPFAGALGVGTGLVSVPTALPESGEVSLRLEMERTVAGGETGVEPGRQNLGQTVLNCAVGTSVDRVLGDRYQIRFDLSPEVAEGRLALNDFTVTDLGDSEAQEILLSADLRPAIGRPVVLGLADSSDSGTDLWLRLTWLAAGESLSESSER